MTNTETILARLAEAPGSTAVELDTTIVNMKALEANGLVVNIGNRATGKRGRPPVEWAVAGSSAALEDRTEAGVPAEQIEAECARTKQSAFIVERLLRAGVPIRHRDQTDRTGWNTQEARVFTPAPLLEVDDDATVAA